MPVVPCSTGSPATLTSSVLSGLAALHPRNDTFPGEVFLHLTADALEWCGASRAEPLPLEELRGSKPAKRRPVLVIQADPYNASRLNTTLAAVITSNTGLAAMPGNVFLPAIASGLPKDSMVNVTALLTLDKTDLDPAVAQLPSSLMHEVDRGLRRALGL